MSKCSSGAFAALSIVLLAACSSGGTDGEVGSTSGAPTTGGAPSIISAPDCGAAREVAAVLGGIDLSDRAGLEALPGQVAELADVVPADLASDVDILSTAVGGLVDVLRKFDFDVAAVEADADAQLDLEELNRPEVAIATQNIQHWIDESCD